MRKISIKQFSNCEAGNVSVIFAVASLAFLGLIGLAIDTSDAHNARADLQAACDSVALSESISIYNGGELDKEAAKLLMVENFSCLLYTSPSPRDGLLSRMPSSA